MNIMHSCKAIGNKDAGGGDRTDQIRKTRDLIPDAILESIRSPVSGCQLFPIRLSRIRNKLPFKLTDMNADFFELQKRHRPTAL